MKNKFSFAVVLAVLAAFFASGSPDGLDKTAETLGFAAKSREHAALMPDYKLPFIEHGGLSTALAAVTGILAIYFLFILIAKLGGRKISPARK